MDRYAMGLELREPVLVIGLGGAGSRLAAGAKRLLGADCLLISNDRGDLEGENSIMVSAGPLVNPSPQAIRGFAMESAQRVREQVSGYNSVIMMANLAGRAGSAIAPVVSSICREEGKSLVSFAVMPFGYQNDRIFASGVSLRRVKADSACTVIVDNDAMLECNPDLTARECYDIANSAVLHMAGSLKTGRIPGDTGVLSTGGGEDPEMALRDSFKMLYGNVQPGSVKSSVIHVLGGDDVPVGMMRTVAGLARDTAGRSAAVDMSSVKSESSGIVMLSTVQGQTKFDGYDPLASIPAENTLDWDLPDCSYDCKLDMYQLE